MSGPELPADVAINKDASHGNLLFVPLRLESGEELPFVVDTGAAATILDKSLEPKLGKRLETGTMWNFGVKHKSGVYATPKLYLGSRLLSTSTEVFSTDLKQLSARSGNRIMGILGMDCLRYYCIQLDFAAGKVRFLAPGQVDDGKWGRAFPIMLSTEGNSDGEYAPPYVSCGSLIGGEGTHLLINTGYEDDGALEAGPFRQEVLQQRLRVEGDAVSNEESGYVWFQKCHILPAERPASVAGGDRSFGRQAWK